MNGLGFLIWKLSAMPSVDRVISTLKSVGAKWVSIKIADGTYKYNVLGGNDKPLLDFITALRSNGIDVGGWHYVYPEQSALQGDVAMERREKLQLSHLLVDAESEWHKPFGMPRAAKAYMDKMKLGGFEVALCSFRYPKNFPLFPFSAFLNHDAMDSNAPQVYWVGADNPVQQLIASYNQYKAITNKPFIPIGPTFGMTLSNGQWWEATVGELKAFSETARETLSAHGFYSLDWVFQYNRMDWLDAIKGSPVTPPPPPASFPKKVKIISSLVNVRSEPNSSAEDLGDILKNSVITVSDEQGDYYLIKDGWIYKNGTTPLE